MQHAIEVNNLTKTYTIYKKEPGILGSIRGLYARNYQTIHAVNNLSFLIHPGELVGFIGPNGAGKTTTLKCLSGLLFPTHGQLSVLGFRPFDRKKAYLKQISLVMGQKTQLWWDLPAIDTFLLNKEIYEIPESAYKRTLSDLVAILDVENFLQVQVRKLSLGERMKMELIAALLHQPKVLFLDEPTIGLDVVMQKKLRDFIADYNKKQQATILLTSHYMEDVRLLARRVIIIDHGQIVFDGNLEALVNEFAPYKILSIILEKQVKQEALAKIGEVEEYMYPKATLRIPRAKTKEAAAKVLKQFSVDDLTIEEPGIEDIIRDVFKNKKPHA